MVRRIDTFIRWLSSIATSAIAIGTYAVRSSLQSLVQNSPLALFILLVIVVLLSQVADYLIRQGVSKARWIRRYILGRQFVEGYWVDRVIEGGQVESVGLLTIAYDNGQLEINGESLDTEGRRLGTFRTYISEYDNWEFRYAYHGMHKGKSDVRIDGYGEYHFVRGDRIPLAFSGFLHDSRHMKQVLVQAEKVWHPELIAGISSKEGRKRIIELFLADQLLQWQVEKGAQRAPSPDAREDSSAS